MSNLPKTIRDLKQQASKLQQENAELKAVITAFRNRQGRSRIIEQSLAKIKADAIRKMLDDLGIDDSGWYGDIEEYADKLEQDDDRIY